MERFQGTDGWGCAAENVEWSRVVLPGTVIGPVWEVGWLHRLSPCDGFDGLGAASYLTQALNDGLTISRLKCRRALDRWSMVNRGYDAGMSNDTLECIPAPRGHWLRVVRQRVLPVAFFGVVLLAVAFLWNRRLVGVPAENDGDGAHRWGGVASTGRVGICREHGMGESAAPMISDAR